MDDTRRYERAREIARRKVDFIRHFFIYALVLGALAIINNVTWNDYQWWLWVAFGWGIGVVSHFLAAFVFQAGGLEERLTRREMEKLGDGE